MTRIIQSNRTFGAAAILFLLATLVNSARTETSIAPITQIGTTILPAPAEVEEHRAEARAPQFDSAETR